MRIHHLALRTPDVARLVRFYADTLGLPVVRRDEARGSVWIDAGGSLVMIERATEGEPPVDPRSMELVAFGVEDKESWRGRVPALEAETAHTLYFRDPDGRRVALSDYPLP